MWLVALVLFHLVFFRKFYFINPYYYARGEVLECEFPSSRLLGEALRRGELPGDPYYYPHYTALPFKSSFYPPHMLQAYLGSFLAVDSAFILYWCVLLLHYLLASVGAYLLFSSYGSAIALFGAITLTHSGYCVKQTSSLVYTIAWIPWMLLGATHGNPILFGLPMGLCILGGYWPLALYGIPFACLYWLFF